MMGWVRIDDHFDEHPKLARVGPLGWGLWLKGLAYCNRNLTDGFIPRAVAHSMSDFELVDHDDRLYRLGAACGMSGDDITSEWVIGFLLDAGLWHSVAGGYEIHDYAEYQPTKAEVEAERAKVAARVNRHRNARRNAVTNSDGNDGVTPPPNPKPKEVSPSSSNSTGIADSPSDDDELWQLVAQRKLAAQPAGSIRNPQPWLTKTARNARQELAERAQELQTLYDVPVHRLADVLANGGQVPQDWQHHRR
jgi:hypothetical protein